MKSNYKRTISKNNLIAIYLIFFLALAIMQLIPYIVLFPAIHWLLLLVVSLNISAFLLFGFDKILASCGRGVRLPERAIYIMAILGCIPALMIGLQVFNHKVSKSSFLVRLGSIFLLQIAVTLILLYIKFS